MRYRHAPLASSVLCRRRPWGPPTLLSEKKGGTVEIRDSRVVLQRGPSSEGKVGRVEWGVT